MTGLDLKLRAVVDAAAGLVGLPSWEYRGQHYEPGVWLEGLILGESSGDRAARRYEGHQDRSSPLEPDRPGVDDGAHEDDASYGIAQVMGYNARRLLGVPDRCDCGRSVKLNYSFLGRPLLNLSLGLTILTGELATVFRLHPQASDSERVERALCRYNGGPSGDALVNGDYRLRRYVDHVAKYAQQAQGARAQA